MASFSFKHPCTLLITGPTGSGKTRFVVDILRCHLFDPFPSRLIWFYQEWQAYYDEMKEDFPTLEFSKGINDEIVDSIQPGGSGSLLILDDLMSNASQSKKVADIFTQESHHKNLSVILILQNLFFRGNQMRTISLNAHYIVLYKNPRDKTQIRYLS